MKLFRIYLLTLSAFYLFSSALFSQRSKDGAKVVATANNIVNEYTTLTANAAAGVTTITVANSTLNANARFPGALAAGDLIMIIQIQGATILGQPWVLDPNFGDPRDSTWGGITSYNNCGNWEFGEVYSINSGTSITLDCPLTNNYTSAGRAEIVRVPRYSSLTVNAGGSITCDTWNGSTGGVCAMEVENNTIINAGGSIDVSGKGFRGGSLLENLAAFGVGDAASIVGNNGAEKGEGIAGYQADYTPYGGRYCRGAPANGGGGGNAHNGGGGGGANGGNPLLWNGHGIPDLSVAAWTNAWNLQYAGFAAQTSSGGGQGGYTFSASNQNATVTGPNNAAWGGDQRRSWAGIGGRPLDYTTGRLFLGGGGGAGDQNDNEGGEGGNGGGLIYIMNYGTVSGAGQIISNGNNGVIATGVPPANSYAGEDGAGGGGAGGTIVINSVGNISGVSVTANGGNGGNQVLVKGALLISGGLPVDEAEGPGGGGSGGHIAISAGAPVRTTNGGANGTTNSDGLLEFIPNGATKGDAGTNNASVTNFIINAPNVTICAGQSATLTVTLNGTVPGGTTITWYDNLVAGNVLGTGNTYTTAVLASGTYTYYVGTCPGTYHQPVVVTVTSSPAVSAGNDATICSGGNTTLNASGGTGYAWSPATGLSNPNISDPVASPTVTTNYSVTVTNSCGSSTDAVNITVNPLPIANAGADVTICQSTSTTLNGSGGGTYAWSPATGLSNPNISDPVASPTITTNYSVTVTNSCGSSTDVVTVTVNPLPIANAGADVTICQNTSTTLNGSGGGTYAWSPATGLSNPNISDPVASPTITTNYSVTVTNSCGSSTDVITVTVNVLLTANAGADVTICQSTSTTLNGSGGGTYAWSPATGLSNPNISDPVASPTITTNYSVTVTNSCGSSTDVVTVTVNPLPIANAGADVTICQSTSTTLNGSGGGTYAWSPATGLSNPNISDPVASPTITTNYSVTVTNSCGSSTDVVTVTVNVLLTANAGADVTICQSTSTTLNGSGGGTYAWSPATGLSNPNISDPVASPTVTTNYSVTVTNSCGSSTDVVSITVNPNPTANISGSATICSGQTATLTATGGGTYSWNTGETTASITVSATTTSSYSVIVSVSTCTATASAGMTISVPSANAGNSVSIVQGSTTTLTALGGGGYNWSTGETTAAITVSPSATTDYCVIVTDTYGCTDSSCVTVFVEMDCFKELYLPNAFSPNGDMENDELLLHYGNYLCIKSLFIAIYNRLGEKVFETTDASKGWDGKYNGKVMNAAVFVYHLEATLAKGEIVSKKGNVSLIK